MLGIIGTLLLVTWVFDYALAFTPGFVQSSLLVFACMFLAVDFVRSQVIGRDSQAAQTPAPAAVVK
jgi:hypothetical protein